MMKFLLRFIITCAFVAGAVAAIMKIRQNKPAQEEEEPSPTAIVQVEAGKVETATLHGYVQAYGEVIPDPGSAGNSASRLLVTSQTQGVITDVHCVEGQKVKTGDILFEMDHSIADILIQDAQAALKLSTEKLSRQEKLLQIKATSEKAIQEARQQLAADQAALSKAKYERSLSTIRSAQDGTVIRVAAVKGASVNVSDVLTEIWDLNRLLILARIPAREITLLKTGQKVVLQTGNSPSEEGEVIFIDDRIDSSTETVNIRISLASGSKLRCGQFVSIRIVCIQHTDCLTVPEESVVITQEGTSTIVLVEGDHASVVPVTTGLKEGGRIEIAGKDIKAGQQVITAGAYGLPDKTLINILSR